MPSPSSARANAPSTRRRGRGVLLRLHRADPLRRGHRRSPRTSASRSPIWFVAALHVGVAHRDVEIEGRLALLANRLEQLSAPVDDVAPRAGRSSRTRESRTYRRSCRSRRSARRYRAGSRAPKSGSTQIGTGRNAPDPERLAEVFVAGSAVRPASPGRRTPPRPDGAVEHEAADVLRGRDRLALEQIVHEHHRIAEIHEEALDRSLRGSGITKSHPFATGSRI